MLEEQSAEEARTYKNVLKTVKGVRRHENGSFMERSGTKRCTTKSICRNDECRSSKDRGNAGGPAVGGLPEDPPGVLRLKDESSNKENFVLDSWREQFLFL